MADPLSEYNKQMMARGLGGALQGEYANPYGMFSGPPKTKLGDITRGILGGIESGGEFLQYLTSPREGGLPKKVTDNVVEYLGSPSEYIKEQKKQSPEYLGEFGGLNKPPKLSEQEMANILSDVETKADDKFDLFKKLSKLDVNFVDPSLAEANKKQTKISQDKTTEDEMLAASGALDATYSDNVAPKKPKDDEIKDLFMSGVDEYMKVLGKEVPPEVGREEALKKYKNEFSEATGIDISGKPDTSAALMSLGLALMQNRAGSGFNVGRILSEVGRAGEKALPMFQEAKKEAKAATAAAGKYALQMIKSDEDAREAIISSNQALKQELALADIEHKNKMEQQYQKAILDGDSAKAAKALEKLGDRTIRIGSKDLKLKRGTDESSGGRVVWQDPVGDVRQVAQAYSKTVKGLDSLSEMNDLLMLMKDESEGGLGGTAGQAVLDQAKRVAKSIGMPLGEFTGGEDVSPREQFERKATALIANFKRYLTSETGNGISTYDVTQIEKALGKLTTFGDVDGALMAINEITPMFTSSLETLENEVELFSDRREYRTGDVGSEQYNTVMEFFGKEFGKTNLIQPTQITRDDGTVVTEYDVSY